MGRHNSQPEEPRRDPSRTPVPSEHDTASRLRDSESTGAEHDSNKTFPYIGRDWTPPPKLVGYSAIEQIGRGGMGVVYKAFNEQLQRTVALKMPLALATAEDRERFLREARAAARLRHPNICPIYEVGERDGQHFLSMPFIEGLTLRQMRDSQPIPPRKAAELAATLCRAAQFAHEHQLIHRDIKPDNVIVEAATGQPLLMDFGLAKDLQQDEGVTVSGAMLGTPAYMAPEQAAGRSGEVGPAADIYALGAVVFYLLTGRPPYQGHAAEVLQRVATSEPPSVRRLNSQVHRDLDTICNQAMARRVADRYASAAAMADDLERFAAGEPILARRRSWPERALRRAARRPWLTLAAALIACGVATIAVTVPPLVRAARLERMTSSVHQQLDSPDWSLDAMERIRIEVESIREVDRERAAELDHLALRRVDRHLVNLLDAERLSDANQSEASRAIELLSRSDPALASRRLAELQKRRDAWETIADWTADPSGDPQRQQLPGPGRRVAFGTPATASQGLQIWLGPERCTTGTRIQARFNLPAESECGLCVNRRVFPHHWVSRLTWSPSGRLLVSACGQSGNLTLWDVSAHVKGDIVWITPATDAGICGLSFTPDGRWLVTSDTAGWIRVRDASSGVEVAHAQVDAGRHYRAHAVFLGPPLAISADGSRVLVGAGDDSESGGKVFAFQLPPSEPQASAATPTRSQAPSQSPSQAPAPLKPLPKETLDAACGAVAQLALCGPDRIAAATSDGRIQIWELSTQRLLRTIQAHEPGAAITTLAWARELDLLASGTTRGLIQLSDPASGATAQALQGLSAGVYSLACDPASSTLAAGYESGKILFWDLQTRRRIDEIDRGSSERCHAVAFGPTGQGAGQGAGREIRRWNSARQTLPSLGDDGYDFLVRHSRLNQLELSVERGGETLRKTRERVTGGDLTLRVARDGAALQMSVNDGTPLVFDDWLPPRSAAGGAWGVRLDARARLQSLQVKRATRPLAPSPLEQGDLALSEGRYAEALQDFETASTRVDSDYQSEAALKGALCLVGMKRVEEARRRLEALTQGDAASSGAIAARFHLLSLLVQPQQNPAWGASISFLSAEQLQAARELTEVIRVASTPEELARTVSQSDRQRLIGRLLDRSPMNFRVLVNAGAKEQLRFGAELSELFQLGGPATIEAQWQQFVAQQLFFEQDSEPLLRQQAKQLLPLLLEELATPNGGPLNQVQIQAWQRACYVTRRLGRPELLETHLSASLYQQGDALRPEITGDTCQLLLERARQLAAQRQPERAAPALRRLLDPALQAPPRIVAEACLLEGFLTEEAAGAEAAQAVWRAAAEHPALAREWTTPDQFDADSLLAYLALRGVAGQLDDAYLTAVGASVQQRLGNNPIFRLMQLPNEAQRRIWTSPRGRDLAAHAARGDWLPPLQMREFLIELAAQMLLWGALREDLDPEFDALARQAADAGYRAYTTHQLQLPELLLLGALWNNSGVFLSSAALPGSLPSDLRAPAALLIARRRIREGLPDRARPLLKQAVESAAPGDPAGAVAARMLQTLEKP